MTTLAPVTRAAIVDAGLDPDDVVAVLQRGLAEDLGTVGDLTSFATISPEARIDARYVARQPGVLAGVPVLMTIYDLHAGADAVCKPELRDGDAFGSGTVIATVSGNARDVLGIERLSLNLLGHLCGIATATSAWVSALDGTPAKVRDTRKTTPGLRDLEKYAVRCGGGVNHRFGLDDAILIKDNHIAACGSVAEAVRRARATAGHLMKVEVEVDSLSQLEDALRHQPDVVMLDNFSLADLAQAVRLTAGRAVLEASGGVTLETVRDIARTGVDVISVGALTHSASILDIGLDAA